MPEDKYEPISAAINRRRLLQMLGSSAPDIDLNSTSGKLKQDEADKNFQEFLKEEYRNIASAHFNAGTTINQFFQFYLLIIGIPVTGAGVLSRIGGPAFDIMTIFNSPFVFVVTGAISVTGLCMLAHLVNIRLEALYYAKAVNGIRKYFYKHVAMEIGDEVAMRGLPRSMSQPAYSEPIKFGGLVTAFAVLDGIYALAAAWSLTSILGLRDCSKTFLSTTKQVS